MRVLVVSAHPDDEILGVGGTIRRHVLDGDEVHVLLACEGESRRYEPEHRASVVRAMNEAAGILGVSTLTAACLPDQGLDVLPLVDVVCPVEQAVREGQPEIVYTHFAGDLNRDHRAVAEAVLVATRPFSAPSVREVLMFETPSSTEWALPSVHGDFTPNVFIDISETLDEKVKAFCCYEREVRDEPHPRSPGALRHRAAAWGSVCGREAAEAFHLVRMMR